MVLIKSPLRYPGGKSKAVKIISALVPPFKEYREPFLGGGSLYVYLKQKHPEGKFWINDIYTNLYFFWKECRDNPEKLIKSIHKFRNQFDGGYKLYQHLLSNINRYGNTNKAAAFFAFNRITFSGTTESGGFSKQAFEKRFTESSIDRVKSLSEILPGTMITNKDYKSLLTAKGKDVFIFLDPPYYSATKSALYGKNGSLHKAFDHERFATLMKETKHKWLITYDDSKYIRELFSFANINTWNLTYGMRNVNTTSSQRERELFISNYKIDNY